LTAPRDKLDDLLIRHATEGLSAAEARDLASSAGLATAGFEQAASAVHLARLKRFEPLPEHVRAKLEQTARRYLAERNDDARRSRAARGVAPAAAPSRSRVRALSNVRGAWLAAAAATVLAVIGWWPRIDLSRSPAAERAALLAAGALHFAWQPTNDPAASAAMGDVVWDPATQRGYMRFVGVAPNAPSEFEYQLWIFDARRDERFPVDGGVFDVPRGAREVIVPIHAKLPVSQAVNFAVTVEKPGGVVVSGRERIVLLAHPG